MLGVHKGDVIYYNNETTTELYVTCVLCAFVTEPVSVMRNIQQSSHYNIIKINYTSTPYIQFTFIQMVF